MTARKIGRMSRLRKRRRGQALVEFALVAPLMLLLILAVIEFSRAWNVYQTLSDAARQGARTSTLARPTITVDTIVAESNSILWSAGIDTIRAVTTVSGRNVVNGNSTVVITYPYTLRFISGLMRWTGAQASFNMNARVTYHNEY